MQREEKLIKEFGLVPLSKADFPRDHKYVRRSIFFAVRGYDEFKNMIKSGDFYILTGIMPSAERIHLGTLAVIEAIKYFQQFARVTILAIADLEALATRDISLELGRKYAYEYHIPSYLALGLDLKNTYFYFQSENPDIVKIASDASREITLNEMEGVYGSISPSRIISSLIQIGDILFPQLVRPLYGLVPVGLDQDPHIRLCREYIRRTRHYNLKLVSSIYLRLIPGLDGSEKMSKSDPENTIFLPEDDERVLKKKIWRAYSGGRPTIEEHRKFGGDITIDVPYKILEFILDDDRELKRIADEYTSGLMLSGELKNYTYNVLSEFMKDFKEKLSYYRDIVKRNDINFITSSKDIKELLM